MPGSQTTQGRLDTRDGVSGRVAFRVTYRVGTLRNITFAARWLACTLPCRRFAGALAGACARLGANVGRYSFIATDFHRLLLAGLPAHKPLNALVWSLAKPTNMRVLLLDRNALIVRAPANRKS
jgi:hypothetical protein